MDDSVVTPARAALIDGYEAVRREAFAAGATGVTVSGAGPAVLAACRAGERRAVGSAMLDAFAERDIEARVYRARVGRGATIH